MARVDEQILNYLRTTGPTTPIEIAKKVGANSLIVSAILIDAVAQKKILRSKRQVGSMRLYYYSEQQEAMRKRISELLTPADKEVLQILMKEQVIGEYETSPEFSAILNDLEDLVNTFNIDYKGQQFKCWNSPNLSEDKAREISMGKVALKIGAKVPLAEQPEPKPKEVEKEVKKEVKKVIKPKEKKGLVKKKTKQQVLVKVKGEFYDSVRAWLEKEDIEVDGEKVIKEGKEFDLEVKVPTPLGKQHYLLRILEYGKKAATQTQVASVGTDAAAKRIPAIIVSSTGFSKSAKKYWEKELQDSVLLVSKDDLE